MDHTLQTLASEVRRKTLWLLKDIPDDLAHFTGGLSNSTLWHGGHALVVVEQLAIAEPTGRPPVLPPGWFDMFSWDSRPATVRAWPPLADVVAQLRDQQGRLAAVLATLSPAQLDRPMDDRGTTARYLIVHALHDEANHQGEMYLLRKLYALRARAR